MIGAGNGIHWPLLDEDISVNGLFTERKKEAEIVSSNIEKIISTIGDIYAKSSELRRISGGRRFIPDGIFVATTGQVVAEYIYGLNPGDKESTLRTWDGKSVKVALTGHTGTGFGIRWTEATKKSHATFLLCLQLDDNGFREIYNGPFPVELLRDRKVPANGQVHLSIAALSDLNPAALDKQHSLASINRLLNAKLAHAA